MDLIESNSKTPLWWQYSNTSWLQVLDALTKINSSELSDQQVQNIYLEKNWKSITTGKSNFNYHLKVDNLEFFVQMINKKNINKLPNSKFIRINQLIQSQATINPYLVPCYYESDNLRLFQWVQTTGTSHQFFNNQLLVNELCEFLVKLHSIKITELPEIDINLYLKKYYEQALKNSIAKSGEIDNLFNQAKSCFKHFQASSLCHHDLSPHNIFLTEHLKIIDWEYAAISDSFMDLSGIANNFQLTQTQEDNFLTCYFSKSNSTFNQKKYNSLKILNNTINQLWYI